MKALDGPWTQPGSMPGWGIVADLTPPELIASRHLRIIRRLMVVVVAAVVVVCAGGYGYAAWLNSQAADGLAAEQAHTSALIAEQRRYTNVTVVRGAIAQVQGQLGGLMTADVNVEALVRTIVTALPPDMTITTMAVTVAAAGSAAASSADGKADGIGSLDLSTANHIGTVTLSGTGTKLSDLAGYVDALRSAPGVFEPYPLSNQTAESGTTYSLQLTLTDALLTHRYGEPGGGS